MLLDFFKINFPDGIYIYDFEYRQPSGENPTVVCMVTPYASELNTFKATPSVTDVWGK